MAAALEARSERRLIALLSLGAFGCAASMRVADAQLPALAEHFGIGLAAVAQVITVFAVAHGVMQIAYGPRGDRLGKWRVIAVAVLLAARLLAWWVARLRSVHAH